MDGNSLAKEVFMTKRRVDSFSDPVTEALNARRMGGENPNPNMPDIQRIFEEGEKLQKTDPPKHLPSYEFICHVGRFCTHDRPHEVVKLTTWIQDTSSPVFGVVPLNDGHRAARKHNMIAVEEYLCRRCKLSFHWSVDPAREAEIIQACPDWKKGLGDGW